MRAIHWFRNDLRLRDNTALRDAASAADELLLLFVLDPAILAKPGAAAPRSHFLLDCIAQLARDIERAGSRLVVRQGDPAEVIGRLVHETRAGLVSWNRDTTPLANARDVRVRAAVGNAGARVLERIDRVVFENGQITRKAGGSYSVYTPFARTWMARLAEEPRRPERAPRLPPPVPRVAAGRIPSAAKLGIATDETEIPAGGSAAARRRLARFLSDTVARYDSDRDRPGVDGTSRLSAHLRFGTLSARDCVYAARDAAHDEKRLAKGARKWIDELIWREFYAAVLQENPENLKRSYRREFERVRWLDDPEEFEAWKQGRTGYPIVDAGMRQLQQTGWMHNRVRMIVASFLTKDLLIDWRKGERFFFERLVDGDPASNNGGWQWAASTGTDPQPYFRIFNPTSQGQRFDPDGTYVRRFIPELSAVPDALVHEPWREPLLTAPYPAPIVDHADRRKLALERYQAARSVA